MAIYLWVGGHTGYTGIHSGFSATGGGTAGNRPYWRDQYGATSGAGDFSFGPYYWGNTMNWLKGASVTGQVGLQWQTTPTLPKGGDEVWFTGSVTAAAGSSGTTSSIIRTNSVSCLYGAMTGDGYTSAGMTAWLGGYTAGGGAHGQIKFTVFDTFGSTAAYSPFPLRTGEIGVGANPDGDFTNFSPLRIRPSQFGFRVKPLTTSWGSGIAIDSIDTTTSSAAFTAFNQTTIGTYSPYHSAFIKGRWDSVVMENGSLFATDCNTTPNQIGYVSIRSPFANNFFFSKTAYFDSYSITTPIIFGHGYIYGSGFLGVGGTAEGPSIFVGQRNGYLTIGSLNGGGTPTIRNVTVENDSQLKLGGCVINTLRSFSSIISVSEEATQNDVITIRDGFADSGVLNMAHPSDENWQNFLLGASGSGDNGLVIGRGLTAIPYKGMSWKTGSPEGGTGSGI
jgi:hypothetical protein